MKRWTIFLIPGDTKNLRKVEMSLRVWCVVIAGILGIIVISVIAGYKIFYIHSDICKLEQMKTKNVEQTKQLAMISQKVSGLEEELSVLRNVHRHLSKLTQFNLDSPEEIVGVGGGDYLLASQGANTEIMTEKILTRKLHTQIKQLSDEIEVEKQIANDLLSQIERQRSLMAHTPALWPCRGWISSRFGWRKSPFTGKKEFHKGLDIASRKGAAVIAVADGIVTASYRNGSYGNFLVINHGYGMVTRYGHLLKCDVEVGQQVLKGDSVAYIGNSGRSTGPHLHYEVLVNGIHVNPQRYMLK
ncbi:MAG: M23 family metallopeptidase [Deltaproteobacteria bacterium]|nr:M23 family metallopeptidase [Deltaproteobacteria bacterium]